MKGTVMSATPLETVMSMSEAELALLQKRIKRQMIKKFVINIATGVAVHFAVGFIINMIDSKKEDNKELTE
jgi:thiosulfate reductase cytochrome b subunit